MPSREPESRDVAAPQKCDVLLLIILPEEWDSFLKIFPEANNVTNIQLRGLTVAVSDFRFSGYSFVAAALNPSPVAEKQQGKVPAAVFASSVLSAYSPNLLVNIGIACRISKGDCKLGDVVVASQLVDVTGNCSVESDKNNATLKFRPGKAHIPCAEEIRRRITNLPTSHPREFGEWKRACVEDIERVGLSPSTTLVQEGFLASGDPLSKSEAFHEIVKDAARNALAYEMEAYAIAEAAHLARSSSQLLILKGLSDDGDGQKNQLEVSTKSRLRSVAGENALRLFRVAVETGIVVGIAPPQGSTTEQKELTASSGAATAPDSQAFPYFAATDFLNCRQLAKTLSSGGGRMEALRSIVKASSKSLADSIDSPSANSKTIARWLNCIVDSDLWNSAEWVVEDTIRLKKIWKDACAHEPQFVEHSRQVVNRLLIEHHITTHYRQGLRRKTPIITCLIENTGHHRALETFKHGFQREHQVVIDFDAVPLAELYNLSNEEFEGGNSRYDIVFHYHLNVARLLARKVVADLGMPSIRRWSKLLIREVEQECCSALVEGRVRKTFVPVNANSMVLVINQAIFDRFRDDFTNWCHGTSALDAPSTWKQFEDIMMFMDTKKGEKVFGIVPQGMRAGDSLYFEWCNFAYGLDGGVFLKEHGWQAWSGRDVIFDTALTVGATEFYKKHVYQQCPTDVKASELDSKLQLERFKKGDVAMAFVWTDMLSELFSSSPSLKYSAHVIPGKKSMVGGGVCCVHKESKNKELALKFVAGLFQPEVQTSLTLSGWCSGYRDVYKSSAVKKLPYARAIEESLSRATHMIEAGPDGAKVRNIVGGSLESIMQGKGDVASILKSAATLLRNELSA